MNSVEITCDLLKVTWDQCDAKYRSLCTKYKDCRDNNAKSGHGTMPFKYYDVRFLVAPLISFCNCEALWCSGSGVGLKLSRNTVMCVTRMEHPYGSFMWPTLVRRVMKPSGV